MARTKQYCLQLVFLNETEEEAYENAKNIALKPKIPRPPNAFMLYANENRKIMAQQFPADSNKEISKKLGSSWKGLDIAEKNKYFDRARVIDLEHKKKYPKELTPSPEEGNIMATCFGVIVPHHPEQMPNRAQPPEFNCSPSTTVTKITVRNYVYNPKEARIRKAMREATRDRSIGASPMLPRPSARRATSHGWVAAHEEQLMMSPMAAGMRGGLDSPVCFPISNGTGSNQFMPPMNAGYSKLESPLPHPPPPPTNPVHTNYMQPNPLAQLQQQAEMWHNYQDDMRPRSSGNPYMMQEVPPPFQHQPSPPLSIPSPMMMDKHRQTPHALHQVNSSSIPMTPPLSNISMTPPHSNENVPPDEVLHHQQIAKTITAESFESKHMIESVQPLMENNNMQHEPFIPVYGQSVAPQPHFEKIEDVKMKKPPVPPQIRTSTKKPSPKPLPDFNEAFGSTERGRFQSPPDPRLAPNKGYLDFFYENSSQIKFEDFQM